MKLFPTFGMALLATVAVSAAPAAPAHQRVKTVTVHVDSKGFSPSRVVLERGTKARLKFIRTSDETCAKRVVFPELGVNEKLPLDEAVTIEVPTSKARTLTFQCGMGMHKSAVVIR